MEQLQEEIDRLKTELERKEKELEEIKQKQNCHGDGEHSAFQKPFMYHDGMVPNRTNINHLDNEAISRYSRQLILPELGVKGQIKLGNTSILIVGAGGLGCPAAIYLAAAGIGRLGIVDYDEVELSNLHRQILHTEKRVGVSKSSSASYTCSQLNSRITCVPYHLALDSQNASELIADYDIVLDATDNVASRYLLNDACILNGKPLVSGSALRFEGQLTVYNYNGGPCYRCLFPKPPPPETVTNCSDGGVVGVVPGIIGSLQALEAIKIAAEMGTTYSQKLLMFDGLEGSFRNIKLRPKQKKCEVCGENPTIKKLIDYEQFCGAKATDKTKQKNLLKDEDRISVKDFETEMQKKEQHILLDVRQPVELEICKLPNTTNLPISHVGREENITKIKAQISTLHTETRKIVPVYVLCRQGNDSQVAALELMKQLKDLPVVIKDIKGGLHAWAKQIDNSFPVY